MKPSIKVSVIIPTYNRPQLVVRSIRSALAQTHKELEVLVMDDSTNDETAKAIKTLHDPRIRYRKNPIRLNFVENKNHGVKMADSGSRYVAFLDDDDEYLPHFLEKLVDYLEKNRDVFAITSYAEFKTQDGESLGIYRCECESWRVSMGNGWVFRREIFFEDGIWFDPSIISEDIDFGIAVAQRHKWKCLPEALRVYYGYPSIRSVYRSNTFTKRPPEALIKFIEKNFNFYKQSGRDALAWAYFHIGKMLCRSGQVKIGKTYFKKAFTTHFKLSYLIYYLTAIFFPSLFGNMQIMILKNRVKKFFHQ